MSKDFPHPKMIRITRNKQSVGQIMLILVKHIVILYELCISRLMVSQAVGPVTEIPFGAVRATGPYFLVSLQHIMACGSHCEEPPHIVLICRYIAMTEQKHIFGTYASIKCAHASSYGLPQVV